MENTKKNLHIVMFPWFAYGHINPFIQLSNKLSSHGIQISFSSIPGNIPRIQSSLKNCPTNQIIPLTIPPIVGLSPNFDSSTDITNQTAELLKLALDQMKPQVESLLLNLKPQIVLFDFAHYWLPSMAAQMNIKGVNFSVFSAVANSYLTVPSRMVVSGKLPSIEDLKKPSKGFPETSSISSMKAFQARDFQYLFKSFNGGKSVFERIMNFTKACDSTIYKSCTEIEGPYLDYIQTQIGKPLILAGCFAPQPESGELEEKWRKWLGKFPEKSVIFCNFGSETYLNNDQIKEISTGLELTNLPFFLVLNFGINPIDSEKKLEESLPEGFRERIKERGVVHTGWVQQQHILAHKSVGCYLNHSGFSSVIEGIVNDCQLVFVPLKGDQFLNSKLFRGDLKVGVEVNRRDDGYFGKDDILEAIKMIMVDIDEEPGKSIRENHMKWRKFFLNKEIEDKYVANLVKELHDLAYKG
uniref:Anthocyanidin 3-O-glucosyltransferase-like protein n=1 Tax=Amaranthus tricolor TaxID=29722 RepID=A0A0D5ME21_AMATR|nr:anthocyanidin 3-O-glucosyltransferase-like protein [Amaranthus tricolor]